ncbi:hypothetical protein ACE6H2_011720 [Prunus campanulata]
MYSHVVVLVVEMVVDVEVLEEVVVVVVVEVEVEEVVEEEEEEEVVVAAMVVVVEVVNVVVQVVELDVEVEVVSFFKMNDGILILTEKILMAETGSSSRFIELDHIQEEIEEVSAVPEVKEKKKSINALRKGSEGEEVRAMQEALQKLGFYSVEEDMEFFSFSSGTERAVKTWQASLDAPQDGIVTAELLEQLCTVAQIEGLDNKGITLTAAQKV